MCLCSASSTSAGYVEPDLTSDDPEWKGISMEEIYKHHGPFDWHHLPPIHPSPSHTILFEVSNQVSFLGNKIYIMKKCCD